MLWIKNTFSKYCARIAQYLLNVAIPRFVNRLLLVVNKHSKVLEKTNGLAYARYETCKKCPLFTAAKTCKSCGCFMPLKTQVETAVCPKGRW